MPTVGVLKLAGRTAATVINRRIRSLGFSAEGRWGKPYGQHGPYVVPARRVRDGARGTLQVWHDGNGWGQKFLMEVR